MAGEEITLFGSGEQSRSNTYIDDCVAGTIQALSAGDPGEVFNIAGGEERTINEALAIIEAEVGKPLNISRHPAARGDQERTRGDSSRAQEKLGFISNTRLEDGLGEQIKWQQNL